MDWRQLEQGYWPHDIPSLLVCFPYRSLSFPEPFSWHFPTSLFVSFDFLVTVFHSPSFIPLARPPHFSFLPPSCPFQFPFVSLSFPLDFLSFPLPVPCMSLNIPLFPLHVPFIFPALPLRFPFFPRYVHAFSSRGSQDPGPPKISETGSFQRFRKTEVKQRGFVLGWKEAENPNRQRAGRGSEPGPKQCQQCQRVYVIICIDMYLYRPLRADVLFHFVPCSHR